jgi:hypothetical protein
VVSRSEEVGNSGLLGEPIDEPHETDVPLCRVPAIEHRVAALEHEAHRVGPVTERRDRAEHGLDDEGVLVLELDPVPAPPRIAVDDIRETSDIGALGFRRNRDEGCLDGDYFLRGCFRRGRPESLSAGSTRTNEVGRKKKGQMVLDRSLS